MTQAEPERRSPGSDGLTLDQGRGRVVALRVEDRRGVLQRVVNLLGRRGFGIATCSVGASSEPGVAAISLRVDVGAQAPEQVKRQLEKLIDVVSVDDVTEAGPVEWSSALVRLRPEAAERALGGLRAPVRGSLVRHQGDRAVAALGGPPEALAQALSGLGQEEEVEWVSSGPLVLLAQPAQQGPGWAPSLGGA